MIFRELEQELSDTDTDTEEEQPKKIKYSKFLKEEEFIDDDAVIPF
jgi:hypothetical protein